jgi:transketolase
VRSALPSTVPSSLRFGPRRAVFFDASAERRPLTGEEVQRFESLDLLYRTLCGLLYNYVPTSGHPGGSISSGRFVEMLLFSTLEYDLRAPLRDDADVISFAAGHKALGLYALWAMRNEIARLGAPSLLPDGARLQFRLEDLLGFRRNPQAPMPLARSFGSRALDGHPTPATPFVRLATGASGVGLGSSVGLALAAADVYGTDAPRVHVVEGEGGLTPGRASEALAIAGTASLANLIVHLDWNQSSIDSDRVCREGTQPGDYVQWEPAELFFLHDWNVVYVPDGKDFQQIAAAQRTAQQIANGQPTAIVYRTVKGWQYGIEGRASHGAGHKLCSTPFFQAMDRGGLRALPQCDGPQRCEGGERGEQIEQCFWDALCVWRAALQKDEPLVEGFAARLRSARDRLDFRARQPRSGAPRIEQLHRAPQAPVALKPGDEATLRAELARVLLHYNQQSGGALLIAAADLLGSTSIGSAGAGFPKGFFQAAKNPHSRVVAGGGICEDAIAALLSGISAFGHHAGVGASYAAFLAPLGHVAARLHAIGEQARQAIDPGAYRPMILVCAHAGLKTGEDGATHADPQALQLLQENFPAGTAITLTPWEPQEIAPLFAEALARRPAVIAPFVTRPQEAVLDRAALSLAPAAAARQGVYLLRAAQGKPDGTVVLQGSGVAYAFVEDALPVLGHAGIDLDVFYVSSAELFDALPEEERRRIFPEHRAEHAMGITDFTLATLLRWVTSGRGRAASLHPFMHGRYPGSGPGARVLEEAGLDGESQARAIRRWLDAIS